MKYGHKGLVSLTAMLVCFGLFSTEAKANNLSAKKNLMHQLQSKKAQNAEEMSNEQNKASSLKANIASYQSAIDSLNSQIAENQKEISQVQSKLQQINAKLVKLKKESAQAQSAFEDLARGLYEDGNVSYLEVLFKATSFSDFLTRFNNLSMLTKSEKQLVDQIITLNKQVKAEKKRQTDTYQTLSSKRKQLQSLQQVDENLKEKKQAALSDTQHQIHLDAKEADQLNLKIKLTSSQIKQLEEQVKESEAIMATSAGPVTVPELSYQDISPTLLYKFVQEHDSTFSLQDIETICAAAKNYDINPALMVAITGQEQAFVPPGPDADKIRNNPFNVFYSWQVYNTNLADAANIAADTLRHKLSTPPPSGENPIMWINDPKNPWGIYATDTNWSNGVLAYFNDIMSYVK